VVGAIGAGKSTIRNLIERFYVIQRVAITIDELDIRHSAKADLCSRLSHVFQEPFIFRETVADNISLNTPGIKRADVIRTAKTVNVHPFIMAMPQGYATVLKNAAKGFYSCRNSSWLWRVQLLQDPELLFVLDEASACVDTATEMFIENALGK